MPDLPERARPPGARATARVQAASKRIQQRRRKSAWRLWGTAGVFFLIGIGICYGYYVVNQPEPKRNAEPEPIWRLTSYTHLSTAWNERAALWRDKQSYLRKTDQKGFGPEARTAAWGILKDATTVLNRMRWLSSSGARAQECRTELLDLQKEWDALMDNLPARTWEDPK